VNVNLAKIGLLGLSMILLAVLVGVGELEADQTLPLFTLVIGYAAGNGVNAYRGQSSAPLFVPKKKDDEEGDA
jgi:hypothetical protein